MQRQRRIGKPFSNCLPFLKGAGFFRLVLTLFLLVFCTASIHAGNVRFADYFGSGGRLLTDVSPSYTTTVNLYDGSTSPATLLRQYGGSPVSYSQGYFEISIPESEFATLNRSNLYLGLEYQGAVATYPIYAVPLAMSVKSADFAKSVPGNGISGTFTSTFNVAGNLIVSQNLLGVYQSSGRVGVGVRSPLYPLDVNGYVNATQFKVDGVDLREVVPWRSSFVVSKNIYTMRPFVGIGVPFPIFGLHVASAINAKDILVNGNPLSVSKDWIKVGDNVYLNRTGKVSIGTSTAYAQLDVRGGIKVSTTSGNHVGTIRWASVGSGADFQGYVGYPDELGVPTQSWVSLTGFRGDGRSNRLVAWSSAASGNSVTYVPNIFVGSTTGYVGIGGESSVPLAISGANPNSANYFSVMSSANNTLFAIPSSGSVGIGLSNPDSELGVAGIMNATDLYVNGAPIRLGISKGTYWLRNNSNSLYYLHGNVGIGRPDPINLLEIAAPNHEPLVPTTDPAITFTARAGSVGQTRYTMGINAKEDGVFRIEKGAVLGQTSPLFVALADRFGVGISNPKANLHVSGNLGLILAGGRFDSGVTLSAVGAGSKMFWSPAKGALRMGNVAPDSTYLGTEFDDEKMGLVSIGFGLNPYATGTYAGVFGGANNIIPGAYAATIGGSRLKAAGDFAVALGRGSSAARHGSFVWGDAQDVPEFRAVTENQFLIRASGGVGVGSSKTFWDFGGEFRYISLLVAGIQVQPASFLGLLAIDNDWASAQLIFNELIDS
ncbi:hypothetical protein EBR96_03435, partial [bacterium]|nr:hypothetical protein [bacterium]